MFSGVFCKDDAVIREVLSKTGYKAITDNEVAAKAGKISGMSESKIRQAFSAKTSVFNRFTHEKERSVAYLRRALAEIMAEDNLIIAGFSGMLIPETITHALKICLIADLKSRAAVAAETLKLSEKEALNTIHKQDEDRTAWISTIFDRKDPWSAALYDIIIPTDKMSAEEAAQFIANKAKDDVVKFTESSKKAIRDFMLASDVEAALAGEGHHVGVTANDGHIVITINKHVLMLGRLEEELKSAAGNVKDVKSVETRVGQGYYQADIYRKYDFEVPSRVLLVDDEREFVQTLSERLMMRDMGSAVAYDGESALNMVRDEDPEVMILDLRMPGIDGIEVLRRVKESHPNIEVIILTGHGSEEDREVCMKLGAFAYLQKPVDIEVLSKTLKDANEKIRQKK
jgi:CheY-like chemotaxis protein/cytidylate kinase